MLKLNHLAGFGGKSGGDPYWAQVVCLLGFDGADGGTTFTDAKGHSITNSGCTTVTSQTLYGTATGKIDGSSAGDYLEIAGTGSDFTTMTGDFTIEWFMRAPSTAANYQYILAIGGTSESASMCFGDMNSYGAGYSWRIFPATGTTYNVSHGLSGVAVTNLTWQHHALVRNGSSVKHYVDGTEDGSITDASGWTFSTNSMRIGAITGGGQDFHIDELRFTKGVARYTAAFTPPVGPFPRG